MNAFKFDVGTYPTLVMRSRAYREGIYAGVRSGKHRRLPSYLEKLRNLFPRSQQVRAINRKQRKQIKLNEGEM